MQSPESTVSTPTFVAGGAIPLTFSVSDASPSSGLEFVDLWYYREPAGPWTYTGLFSTNSNGVLNWVPPGPGIYYFFSRAKDNAQNIESGVFGPPPLDSVTNYGNICDPDLNNDGVVNFLDIQAWTSFFNVACGNVDEDFNGDGLCNFIDFQLFSNFFLQPAGPSGVAP